MPLYKKFHSGASEIAVWKIDEPLSFFEAQFSAHPHIQHEARKLQWFASRHLVNLLAQNEQEIEKDEAGKPFLKNTDGHISISHAPAYAAAILNMHGHVGIDLEAIHPKVERIAHKFLRADEIAAIAADQKTRKLILYWSAKESLFKLYGKGGVDFKTQLLIEPFTLQIEGALKATIAVGDDVIKNLSVYYSFFDGHVLSYVSR